MPRKSARCPSLSNMRHVVDGEPEAVDGAAADRAKAVDPVGRDVDVDEVAGADGAVLVVDCHDPRPDISKYHSCVGGQHAHIGTRRSGATFCSAAVVEHGRVGDDPTLALIEYAADPDTRVDDRGSVEASQPRARRLPLRGHDGDRSEDGPSIDVPTVPPGAVAVMAHDRARYHASQPRAQIFVLDG